MQNLLQLILRYSTLFSFLILEFLAFFMVVQYNQKQNKIFASSSSKIVGDLYMRYDRVKDFLGLRNQLNDLKAENASLRSKLDKFLENQDIAYELIDSLKENIKYIPATVISRSDVGKNNTLTLDKGKIDGIMPHMGVITKNGIVGIVRNVSDHFSVVMSIYHSQSKISTVIKSRDINGSLVWEDLDMHYMNLNYVPKFYKEISPGDTLVTSSYSSIFPPGIEIGFIEEISEKEGDNNFVIRVKMKDSFYKINNVYVVDIKDRLEKDILTKEANEQ